MAEATGDPLTQMWTSLKLIRDQYATSSQSCRLFFDLITISFTNYKLRQEVTTLYDDLTAETTAMFRRIAQAMPTPMPIPEEEFAAVLLATIDGVLLRSSIEPEFGPDRLFRALGFLWTSCGSTAWTLAGEEPPLGVFEEILASAESPTVAIAPADQA